MQEAWNNFLADLKESIHFYDNGEFDALNFNMGTFRLILLFIWIGAVFAQLSMYYNNHYLGGFVQKLIQSGAKTREEAKTLSELGLEDKYMLKYSLRAGSVLRKVVMATDKEGKDENGKSTSVDGLAFYIPEELEAKAQKRYRLKGNGLGALITSIIVTGIIMFLALIYSPLLLQFLDGLAVSYGATK